MQDQPDRLRPQLHPGNDADTQAGDGNGDQGADQMGIGDRDAQDHHQRLRHDGRLHREQDEGEGGIDQRRDGRADIAEAGAAGQQIHVDAGAGGVIGDRQAGQEDHQPDGEDGVKAVGEAEGQRDGAADRLAGEKGDGAERGVADAEGRPAARLVRGEAQGVILQRLVGDPLVILPPPPNYPLRCRSPGFSTCFQLPPSAH